MGTTLVCRTRYPFASLVTAGRGAARIVTKVEAKFFAVRQGAKACAPPFVALGEYESAGSTIGTLQSAFTRHQRRGSFQCAVTRYAGLAADAQLVRSDEANGRLANKIILGVRELPSDRESRRAGREEYRADGNQQIFTYLHFFAPSKVTTGKLVAAQLYYTHFITRNLHRQIVFASFASFLPLFYGSSLYVYMKKFMKKP